MGWWPCTLVNDAASKMVSTVMGSRLGKQRPLAVGFAINDFAIMPNQQNRAWDNAVFYRLVDLLIGGRCAWKRFLSV